MLDVDVVAEVDAAHQVSREVRPEAGLLGYELTQAFNGESVLCADVHSSCAHTGQE